MAEQPSPRFRARVDELRRLYGFDIDAAWLCAARELDEQPDMPKARTPCVKCREKKKRAARDASE